MKRIKSIPPTQERLREVLEYNPETGVFTWIKSLGNRTKMGEVAGSAKGGNYGRIQIDGVRYLSHRLAWLYVFGYYPETLIDHINNDFSDNRISNLRLASASDNSKNCRVREKSKTGVKGVTESKSCPGKYEARLGFNGVSYYLGVYNSIEEARVVLDKKREELHGEFTNYG